MALAQPSQIIIDDTRVFPESLTSTADGTVIIGSMEHGTIYHVAPGAAKATAWIAATPNGLRRVLGVFVNEAANTLWVCTNDPDPNGKDADLKAFDLKTAAPKGSYPFPGGGLCNDIAVARDGTTYVTDTRGGTHSRAQARRHRARRLGRRCEMGWHRRHCDADEWRGAVQQRAREPVGAS